ncbi:hypothetical protein INR49_010174 [Caranx melampygus]|nr:hypothetical protein INR49_010174 [Caranx melampygus]
MDDRGRMLVLFFFLVSLVSTTMMTQSAEPWVRKLFCQRIMSSFTTLLYISARFISLSHPFHIILCAFSALSIPLFASFCSPSPLSSSMPLLVMFGCGELRQHVHQVLFGQAKQRGVSYCGENLSREPEAVKVLTAHGGKLYVGDVGIDPSITSKANVVGQCKVEAGVPVDQHEDVDHELGDAEAQSARPDRLWSGVGFRLDDRVYREDRVTQSLKQHWAFPRCTLTGSDSPFS